jgi:enoyl-CoA hydratase/carnithine racemase
MGERATNASYVKWPNFEEIKEMFKEHFIMDRREDGVVTVRMHCLGGPLIWSMEMHDAIGKMWRMLGTDRETEMIIFTGTGNVWVSDFETASWAPEGNDPGETRYNHMFVDGRRMVIAMIQDVEVPTLGVLSGSGGHTELALLCDLAIAADDITVLDPHMLPGINNVPGDGIHSCFFELLPARMANWHLMTGAKITAQDLVRLHMVSEIVPREKLMDRAYEIADMLMAQNRVARRLTSQLVKRNWKKRIADDLDMAFGTELFGMFCANELHSQLTSILKHLDIEDKIDPPFAGKIR